MALLAYTNIDVTCEFVRCLTAHVYVCIYVIDKSRLMSGPDLETCVEEAHHHVLGQRIKMATCSCTFHDDHDLASRRDGSMWKHVEAFVIHYKFDAYHISHRRNLIWNLNVAKLNPILSRNIIHIHFCIEILEETFAKGWWSLRSPRYVADGVAIYDGTRLNLILVQIGSLNHSCELMTNKDVRHWSIQHISSFKKFCDGNFCLRYRC